MTKTTKTSLTNLQNKITIILVVNKNQTIILKEQQKGKRGVTVLPEKKKPKNIYRERRRKPKKGAESGHGWPREVW